MTNRPNFYQVIKPDDEKSLATVEYEMGTIHCDENPMHQAIYDTGEVVSVQFPRKIPKFFCCAWTHHFLVSRTVASLLQDSGMKGFVVREIKSDGDSRNVDFVQLIPHWHGEFECNPSNVWVDSYCAGCSSINFQFGGDEPEPGRCVADTDADIFVYMPYGTCFVSKRANDLLRSVCGKEFVSVLEGTRTGRIWSGATLFWNHLVPQPVGISRGNLWAKIKSLDVNGVLPKSPVI